MRSWEPLEVHEALLRHETAKVFPEAQERALAAILKWGREGTESSRL